MSVPKCGSNLAINFHSKQKLRGTTQKKIAFISQPRVRYFPCCEGPNMRLMSRISTLHCAVEGDSSFFSLDGQPLLGIIKYKFEHFLRQKKKKRKRPIRHGFVCETSLQCASASWRRLLMWVFFFNKRNREK